MNIAVQVQQSLVSEKRQKAIREEELRAERRILGNKVLGMITMVDLNSDGELSAEEIDLAFVRFPHFKTMLEDLGVPAADGQSLVQMLDTSGDGLISYEELADGIVAMDEELGVKDWVKLSMRAWALLQKAEYLNKRLQYLSKKLIDVTTRLRGAFESVDTWNSYKETSDMVRKAKAYVRSGPAPQPLQLSADLRRQLDGRNKKSPRVDQAPPMLNFVDRYFGEVTAGPSEARREKYKKEHDGQELLQSELPEVMENTSREAEDRIRIHCTRAAAMRITAPTRRKPLCSDAPEPERFQKRHAVEMAKKDLDPLMDNHPMENVSKTKLHWVRDLL